MNWFKNKRIFLDYASATPVLPEVRKMMERYWSEYFYNPSSIYKEGVIVKEKIAEYRRRVARIVGVTPSQIVFTSSGTESDNLAILGAFEKALETMGRPHIMVSAIEHPAVLAAAEEVKRRGGEMSIIPVNEEGVVSMEAIKKLLKRNTFMISVSLANGEIGTVEPVAKIGRLVREFRKSRNSPYPYLHVDASQAVSFLNINIESLLADLLTVDSSKIYGPKGAALLAIRRGVNIRPMIVGGNQEGGYRSGTLNPALIAGFTLALEIAERDREKESMRLEGFRKYFIESVIRCLPEAVINGSSESHLPNIVSVSIPNVISELILLKLDIAGLQVSVGSACSYDERVSGSPVIRALGKPELSESTLRFSFGRFTTKDEIKSATEIFCRTCASMVK